jgi:hypothetical protein
MVMTYFFQRQPPRRAPRAHVRGSLSAVIRLENGRQFLGKMELLSITGGLVDLASYVEERSWVELTIYLSSGAVRTIAEMMFPMRGGKGYLQPFRFTSLSAEALHAIDRDVSEMIERTVVSKGSEPTTRAPRYYLDSW